MTKPVLRLEHPPCCLPSSLTAHPLLYLKSLDNMELSTSSSQNIPGLHLAFALAFLLRLHCTLLTHCPNHESPPLGSLLPTSRTEECKKISPDLCCHTPCTSIPLSLYSVLIPQVSFPPSLLLSPSSPSFFFLF
jgi:hypothetical protein